MPAHYYPFACKPVHFQRNVFIAITGTTSGLSFILTMAPQSQSPKWQTLITTLYIIMGINAALPLYYILLLAPDHDHKHYTKIYTIDDLTLWILGGALYIIGGIIYAARCPERQCP